MDVFEAIRRRHSARVAFDPSRRVRDDELARLLEAARWTPTAHNMQNFALVVVDDPARLAELGAIETQVSPTFLRENLRQLAASPEELAARKRGLLAAMFPPAWLDPDRTPAPGRLREVLRGAPLVVVAVFDPRERAPASEGDVLGMMSLGCLLENLWLAAEACGLGFQVLSALAADRVAAEVTRVLAIPAPLCIAFGVRIGVPLAASELPRVRRDVVDFTHRNRW